MAVKIKMASSPADTDAVLKLRHQVFCKEEALFAPLEGGRLMDRFDTYDTSCNLMGVCDDDVIAAMRLTLDSGMGIPADEYYDFRAHLPTEARILNSGMYCVARDFRGRSFAIGLQLMAAYYALANDVSHVVAPINPMIARLVGRLGFKALGDQRFDPHLGTEFIPMMLDVAQLNDYFSQFAERNRLYNFLSSYECIFFDKGEYVVRTGEPGEAAFVIIEGEVAVQCADSGKALATMGPGEVFGELALLTDDRRAADVVALDNLRIMSLPKQAFLNHLMNSPEHAMLMLKSMGQRLKSML